MSIFNAVMSEAKRRACYYRLDPDDTIAQLQ
jgi:hypothetical protein